MMFVLIIRIALVPVIDWQALVGLFLALSSYLHKRHTRDKSATQIEAVKASAVANAKEVKIQLDQLNDKVKQLETSNNLSKLSR
jgi:TolA-binding protein